jgi:hypothetical protein
MSSGTTVLPTVSDAQERLSVDGLRVERRAGIDPVGRGFRFGSLYVTSGRNSDASVRDINRDANHPDFLIEIIGSSFGRQSLLNISLFNT